MMEKSSIVPRVDHFNTIAWVLAFVSPLVQHGDQPLGEASLAVIPMKPSSKLQRKMRRKFSKGRKRKSSDEAKGNRRKRKYAKSKDDSVSAKLAYSKHDDDVQPEDVTDDVPSGPAKVEKQVIPVSCRCSSR